MFLRMYFGCSVDRARPPTEGLKWIVGGRKGPAVRMEGSL